MKEDVFSRSRCRQWISKVDSPVTGFCLQRSFTVAEGETWAAEISVVAPISLFSADIFLSAVQLLKKQKRSQSDETGSRRRL